MDFLISHTPLSSRMRTSDGRRASSLNYIASLEENVLTTASGAPASSYWTAYDHYMIEREARAYRRAYAYSMVASFVRHLRPAIFLNFRPAQA